MFKTFVGEKRTTTIKKQDIHMGELSPVQNKEEKEAREAVRENVDFIMSNREPQWAALNSSGK